MGPVTNSANRIIVYDENDAPTQQFASATAAVCVFRLPTIGTAGTASGNNATSENYILAPGQVLVFQSEGAAQTETQLTAVTLELHNIGTIPTWDTTGSAGTPNLAASTISEANTLRELPC